MNIIERIYSFEYNGKRMPIDKKSYITQLNYRDFEFLYRALRNNRTFVYVDTNNEVDFIVKLNKAVDIKEILYYQKLLNIKMDINGPIIELIVEGLDSFEFSFSLSEGSDVLAIKNILLNKKVNLYFVTDIGGKLSKFYTANLNIDEKVIERFIYTLKCLDEMSYPRADDDIIGKEAVLLDVKCDFKILDDLISIVESLQKWGTKDSFSIAVDYNDGFKICLVGNLNNKNYIKTELEKKYSLNETSGVSSGKKFLKFERGMIYFY